MKQTKPRKPRPPARRDRAQAELLERTRASFEALANDYYGRQERLADAQRAVGVITEQRLQWLGDFIQHDLSREEGRVTSAEQLQAFVGPHVQAAIDPDRVPAIQLAVRDLLTGLTPDTVVHFPRAIVDGLYWRAGGSVSLRVTATDLLTQTLTAGTEVLMAVGPRLARCDTPTCQRLFARARPHQRFCTTQCGARFRVAEWRKKHQERHTENRHQQYARKKKAQLPGVRVSRRAAKKRG